VLEFSESIINGDENDKSKSKAYQGLGLVYAELGKYEEAK